jgi:DNA-directed RNA polymerase specialized sigma24 family protein
MSEGEWLAEQFEQHRGRLRAVAFRMLGSPSEAGDAVQEAWLRLSRSDAGAVQNLAGTIGNIRAVSRLP